MSAQDETGLSTATPTTPRAVQEMQKGAHLPLDQGSGARADAATGMSMRPPTVSRGTSGGTLNKPLSPTSRLMSNSQTLLHEMALFMERHPELEQALRSPSRRGWLTGAPTRG